MNLPKREELSFRTVRALPKDSKMGFDYKTCDSKPWDASGPRGADRGRERLRARRGVAGLLARTAGLRDRRRLGLLSLLLLDDQSGWARSFLELAVKRLEGLGLLFGSCCCLLRGVVLLGLDNRSTAKRSDKVAK
jgi:hypothetical protein